MNYHDVDIPRDRIALFCQENRIRRLALFGSILRQDFGPESDVDILVEFESGHRVGYIGMAALERKLSKILGRKVDLRTPAELSRHFRDEVIKDSVVQYAQG